MPLPNWDTQKTRELLFGASQWLERLNHIAHDEVEILLTQRQLNGLLQRFVVQNVDALLHLSMQLEDGHFFLTAIVHISGTYAHVRAKFHLVQAQASGEVQRLVFSQIGNLEILDLHSRIWIVPGLAKTAIKWFARISGRDILPFALNKILISGVPFITYKKRVIYLELGRWLRSLDELKYLTKVQVNDGLTRQGALVLRAQVNVGRLFEMDEIIITEKDNPRPKDKVQPKEPKNAQEDTTPDTTHPPTYQMAKAQGNPLPNVARARRSTQRQGVRLPKD